MLLPFQGDRRAAIITQGGALGWELLPFQGVLLKREGRGISPRPLLYHRYAATPGVP